MTSRTVGVMTCLTWVYGATASSVVNSNLTFGPQTPCVIYILASTSHRRLLLSLLFIFLLSITTIYTFIMRAIKHQHRSVASQNQSEGANSEMKQNLRVLKAFTLVVGIFCMCWIPFMCLLEVSVHTDARSLQGPAFVLFPLLVFTNSAANPFIYAHRMTPFRLAMKRIVCGRCRSGDQSSTSQNAASAGATQ